MTVTEQRHRPVLEVDRWAVTFSAPAWPSPNPCRKVDEVPVVRNESLSGDQVESPYPTRLLGRFHVMQTEPVAIPGVAGHVVLDTWIKEPQITVAGYPVPRVGRGEFALPGVEGRIVVATVRFGLIDRCPVITIDGIKHRMGPRAPAVLRMLAVLPLVLFVGGAIGGLVGSTAIACNSRIVQTSLSGPAKAARMVAVFVAAGVTTLALAHMVSGVLYTLI
jgi:hypothetical protein